MNSDELRTISEHLLARSNEVLTTLRGRQNEQNTFQGEAHDRLLKIATQVSLLFLTGWVALLSVGKIGSPPFWTLKGWILVCCGGHVLTLATICYAEWRITKLHAGMSDRIDGLYRTFESTREEIEERIRPYFLMPSRAPENLLEQVKFIESKGLQVSMKTEKSMSEMFTIENGKIWVIGVAGLYFLFGSILLSTLALVSLVGT